MVDPVTALVRARVLAPRLRLDRTVRARALDPADDLELAVLQDLADQHRPVGVLVVLVHLDRTARRHERLAVHGLADRVDIEALRLLHGLLSRPWRRRRASMSTRSARPCTARRSWRRAVRSRCTSTTSTPTGRC